tara:strand:- start:324 stop:971 length:648 start_codon:yes stop_codon:yes gene_type:complete
MIFFSNFKNSFFAIKNCIRFYSFSKGHNLESIIASNSSIDIFKKNLLLIDKNFETYIKPKSKETQQIYFKSSILNELNLLSFSLNLNKHSLIKEIRNYDYSNLYNEYNYYKYPLLNTDFCTAYFIIWGINAKTPLHYHSSNGCYMLTLDGMWKENIYNNKGVKKDSQIYKSNNLSFIDNTIGCHDIKYLNKEHVGLSINIYSPSIELLKNFKFKK